MTPPAGPGPAQRARIAGLLGRCVVQVQAGPMTGTGFFIAPRQVLTCRHVVAAALGRRGAPVSVRWFPAGSGESVRLDASVLEAPDGNWPDVAVLAVPGAADCPCVVLDAGEVLADTPLLAGGYPAGASLEFQPQRFTAGYPAHSEGQAREVRIEGDLVSDGMSGSPIVSLGSGLVVGIVRITKGTGAALGGFGTMFADILDKVPRLQPLGDRPPAAAAEWIRAVGAASLKEADRDWKTGARWRQTSVLPRIDLMVEQDSTGAAGAWHVEVRSARAGGQPVRVPRSAAELGEGVLRAVDGWSRRQAITTTEEARILGRVLDRALLPGAARTAVDDDLAMPPFLLRVCADNGGGLSRLPWEYAWGDDAVPLSVHRDLAFVRFADVGGAPPPARDRLRVLAVTEFPVFGPVQFRGYTDESGQPVRPSRQEFGRIITETFLDSKRVQFELAPNYTASELRDKLAEEWDVVHYLGFGWATGGRISISMGCGNRSDFTPVPLAVLRDDYLAPSRCAVFVAEFHPPPLGRELGPPADPAAFTALLRGDLHAVVATQHPADLVDLRRFNDGFYEKIAKGDIVELAVQAGRRAVRDGLRPAGDVTAFGAFTVTTRRAGEVRLLQPRLAAPGVGRSGPREAAAAGSRDLDTAASAGAGA